MNLWKRELLFQTNQGSIRAARGQIMKWSTIMVLVVVGVGVTRVCFGLNGKKQILPPLNET